MCRYPSTKSTTTANRSKAISPTRAGKCESAKSCSSMTPAVVVKNVSIQDWLTQPVRAFELAEAESVGVSVRELRERFLVILNAWMKGSANDLIN
jgi:hypothetical protein